MIFLHFSRFGISKLSQNLKLLNLKIPTSQHQIKTKYRQLAKQYHPDTLKQAKTKQSQQHFVLITTAYNQLKQLDDKKLARLANEYDSIMPQEQKQKARNKQEQLKQETCDHFRKKQFYAQKKKNPANDKPLYKTIPELFVGSAFVAILFGDWIFKTLFTADQEFKQAKMNKQDTMNQNFFNAAKRFKPMPQQKPKRPQLISQKQQRNLIL